MKFECRKCKNEIYVVNSKGLCINCIQKKQAKKDLNKTKQKVLIRDNFTCQECKRTLPNSYRMLNVCDDKGELICSKEVEEIFNKMYGKLEVHHIKPIYLGGTDYIENLITLCKECHNIKHKTRQQK